jgi:flagellar motor switch protein FliG
MDEKLLSISYFNILCTLDDYAIQKIIRETANNVLAQALKTADKKILSAVLRSMSKRAAKMLIEEMEYIPVISHEDIQKARRKIANLIQELEMTGEIIVPKFNQDEK